jgi:hypothetical protein
VGSIEEPISRGEYRRKETEILFGIELLLYRWGLSEFSFDEERQVFCDEIGRAVLSRHQADRERCVRGVTRVKLLLRPTSLLGRTTSRLLGRTLAFLAPLVLKIGVTQSACCWPSWVLRRW